MSCLQEYSLQKSNLAGIFDGNVEPKKKPNQNCKHPYDFGDLMYDDFKGKIEFEFDHTSDRTQTNLKII